MSRFPSLIFDAKSLVISGDKAVITSEEVLLFFYAWYFKTSKKAKSLSRSILVNEELLLEGKCYGFPWVSTRIR